MVLEEWRRNLLLCWLGHLTPISRGGRYEKEVIVECKMEERNNKQNESQDEKTDNGSTWVSFKATFHKFMDYTDRIFDIENQRFVVGLNSGIVAAVITSSYRNPVLALRARILLPPVCGITAAKSWQHLITKKLETGELECPACTNIRGLTIAIASASILPLFVGGLVIARRSPGLFTKAEKFTENFSENLIQRPFLMAAVLAQGAAGWIMASREFEKTLIQKLFSIEK